MITCHLDYAGFQKLPVSQGHWQRQMEFTALPREGHQIIFNEGTRYEQHAWVKSIYWIASFPTGQQGRAVPILVLTPDPQRIS